jgi:hypothetical protein
MSTLACTQNVEAEAKTYFAGSNAKRAVTSSDARAADFLAVAGFSALGLLLTLDFILRSSS